MRYYEVQLWSNDEKKWVPVKDVEHTGAEPIIRFGSERLTYAEAKARYDHLKAINKRLSFQVAQINSPYNHG